MNQKKVKKARKEAEAKLFRLDIACGSNKTEGFTGIDIFKDADIVHDLNEYPWPIKSDSVDEIVCNHFVEHVGDLIKFMDEIYRIMKPGSKATITAPYYSSMRAWQDPTHVRAISECSFLYYNKEWRKNNKLDHYPINCDFDFSYGYNINYPWNMRSEESRNFAITHYINVVSDIIVTLVKK
jgi:SAM-dependent methyltransferase